MALQVKNVERIFQYKNKELKDIPGMTPEKVVSMNANEFPELTNASVNGPEIKEGKAVYTITATAGTKG